MMQKSSTRSKAIRLNLCLTVCRIEGLVAVEPTKKETTNLRVQIEWTGRRKGSISRRAIERNCTSKQKILSDGSVIWNEEFQQKCKLKIIDSKCFRRWEANMEIQGLDDESNRRPTTLAKQTLDIAEFAYPIDHSEKTIKFSLNFCISSSSVEAMLTVKLKFSTFLPKHVRNGVHPLSPTHLLPALTSCIRCQNENHAEHQEMAIIKDSSSTTSTDSEADEDSEPGYRNLATMNLHIGGLVRGEIKENNDHNQGENSREIHQKINKSSIIKLLSWNKGKLSFRALNHPRDKPLLNKAYGEDGGDDIDQERRYQFSPQQPRTTQEITDSRVSGFGTSDRFEIGTWEERKLVSRDGKLELVTQIFLASIDQRSQKAAGGGACSVLATIIADWFHHNHQILPLRCQFDKLMREGSSEWRKLCKDVIYREKFSDQHFDLDTIIEAQIRPLMLIPEKSYVGFFELEEMPSQLDFLQGAMSFDSAWEEVQNSKTSSEQIYIVSWNDHFFVLKVEEDAIFLIDTLGERLMEGGDKAFILKFNEESKVYRVHQKAANSDVDKGNGTSGHVSNHELNKDGSSKELVSEGKSSCKEFIKGFLAAVPLRELQANINRRKIGEAPLHHLLQIEFHYTAPRNKSSEPSMEINPNGMHLSTENSEEFQASTETSMEDMDKEAPDDSSRNGD
ncbi:NT-type C2 domain [Dillenia turbinata]|uniref:NT-type C2 domain n=1 Tax=Dillenia turbinata TaxID=194707 RepID=A0AAN8VKE2_9MAGN